MGDRSGTSVSMICGSATPRSSGESTGQLDSPPGDLDVGLVDELPIARGMLAGRAASCEIACWWQPSIGSIVDAVGIRLGMYCGPMLPLMPTTVPISLPQMISGHGFGHELCGRHDRSPCQAR